MAKKERSEDLNPHNEDIEEKIKRMLDPRLPDDITGESGEQPVSHIKIVSGGGADTEKPKESASPEPDKTTPLPPPAIKKEPTASKPATAPELPETDNKTTTDATPPMPSQKSNRKVIVPIDHDEQTEQAEPVVDESEPPVDQPVRQIDVTEHGESSEDLAEKLDKTIAELDGGEEIAEVTNNEDEPETEDTNLQETEKTTVKKTETKKEKPAQERKPQPKKAKVIDDPETDKAVKDIVTKEGDKLLADDDKKRDDRNKPKKKKKGFLRKTFASKPFRWVVLLLFIAIIGTLIAVPEYRYRALNAAGVRASSSVKVHDVTTGQPIKNVTVRIGDVSVQTNDEGTAELTELLLGSSTLIIEKVAYETTSESMTVGWGSNPLGERNLTPTGVQYQLGISDFVSGQGIEGAQAAYQDSNATADGEGLIKLTIPDVSGETITVTISANGYLEKEVTVPVNSSDVTNVKLVSNRKHVFVSNSSGNYDIYSSYVDGSKKSVLLKASGHEQDDLVLLSNPSINRTAYVSTRTNNRNDQGNLTYNLLVFNLEDNSSANVVAADRIQLLGWSGDYIVYITTNTGDDSGQRSKLVSYNAINGTTTELSVSNYFNDVLVAGELVYFAPSSLVSGGDAAKLYSRKVNGDDKRTIVDKEVWKLFRNNFRELSISAQNEWFGHTIGSQKAAPKEETASNRVNRHYVNGPNNDKAVWVDQRDGKGTLLLYDKNSDKDTTLFAKNGVGEPVAWLNATTVIFRVESANETADYAISTEGGLPIKISDVTVTGSTENWYYF